MYSIWLILYSLLIDFIVDSLHIKMNHMLGNPSPDNFQLSKITHFGTAYRNNYINK